MLEHSQNQSVSAGADGNKEGAPKQCEEKKAPIFRPHDEGLLLSIFCAHIFEGRIDGKMQRCAKEMLGQ